MAFLKITPCLLDCNSICGWIECVLNSSFIKEICPMRPANLQVKHFVVGRKHRTHLCCELSRSALLMSSILFLLPAPIPASPSAPSMSWMYSSKSSQRNLRGFRASTIWTTRWERSSTRQSCLHTSRFRSNGVSKKFSCSWSLLAWVHKAAALIASLLSESSAPIQKSCFLLAV